MELLAMAWSVLLAVGGIIALLGFPVYLVWFIRRRLQGRRLGIKKGYSLLTLMLYLLFLIFSYFSLVIAPTFVAKGWESEPYTNLGAIFTTQVVYFGEHNAYAGGPNAFTLINWKPEGRNRYAYFCGDDEIRPFQLEALSIQPGEQWPFTARAESSASGFTCLAIGNLDEDPFLDVWSINDASGLNPQRLLYDLGWGYSDAGAYYQDPPRLSAAGQIALVLRRFYLSTTYEMDPVSCIAYGPLLALLAWLVYRDEKRFRLARAGQPVDIPPG